MSQQSEAWNDWVDRLVDGKKPTVDEFVRSALTDIQPTTTAVRYPNSRKAWPKDVWNEMMAIQRGERDGQ